MSVDRPEPGAPKEAWRGWSKALRRSGVPEPDSRAVAAGLRAWLAGLGAPSGVVLVYFPLPDEIDLTPLLDSGDRTFAVTRTPSRGPLTLHPADAPRERHRYGFEQPVAGAPRVDPGKVRAALVPGLVFDRDGGRLGRGGGYYDRLLPGLPDGAPRVGVTLERLVVDKLPTDSHDVPMTHLATERGVREVDIR